MPEAWRHQILILLVGGVVLFTNLGGPTLWDRDEPRNAGCAREMLHRGDWIVPYFNDELRVHKPALLYWLIMSAYLAFGENEFAARFWSAVLSLGTALLTYHIGAMLYRPRVGLWAALMLTSSLIFTMSGRAATPDATLLFCTTAALFFFTRGSSAALRAGGAALPRRWSTFAAMYGAMAVGVLAKGPVAVVLPTAIFGLYLLIVLPRERQRFQNDTLGARLKNTLSIFHPLRIARTAWSMRPLTAVAALAVIALPWYIAVGVATDGAFVREFLGKHNVSRFTAAMESHRGPVVYYLPAIMIGMFPASVLMGPTLARLVRRIRGGHEQRQNDILMATWAAGVVGFFTLAATKLPSYVLPAYPAIAVLIGACVSGWLEESYAVHRRWFRAAMICLALVGVGVLIGLPLAARRFLPGEEMLGLIGLIPLLGAGAALMLAERNRQRAALTSFAVTCVAVTVVTLGIAPLRVDGYKNSKPLMDVVHAHQTSDKSQIASYRHLRSTYVYYAGQRVDELKRPEDVANYLARSGEAFLIMEEGDYEALRTTLPHDARVLARRQRFLKDGAVLLLAKGPAKVARRPRSTTR